MNIKAWGWVTALFVVPKLIGLLKWGWFSVIIIPTLFYIICMEEH